MTFNGAKKILLFFLLTISFGNCFAQKEWSNWYGNGKNLLTFKNGHAELVNNFIDSVPPYATNGLNFYYWGKGGISYSDPITGDLKFIISQRLGFNRKFGNFPNRESLRSCPDNNPFAYHIIPFHNNPDKFYVFQFQDYSADLYQQHSGLQIRCPNAVGLGYSIVDLSLDGGLGDFTIMNKVIISQLNGQITTVRHANGQDVWIIVHPYNSAKFNAYLVTDAGIQPAVASTIGPMVDGGSESAAGTLTASHDGKMLAGIAGFYSGKGRQIQLFDFNNATGVLSNYRDFPFNDYSSKLQFSPDNSKLYCMGFQTVYQYDLNQSNIKSTETKVVDQPFGNLYDMQLAPDGKIYLSKTYIKNAEYDYSEYTGAIECPNLPKYACNFNPKALNSIQLTPFPDLINDFINDPITPPLTQLNLGNDTAICFGELKISAPLGWESYRWNTGETTREITVKKAGIYHVLTGNAGFSCPEAYGYINVSDKAIKLDLGPDTILCPKTSYLLHISSDYTNVLWQNGSHAMDSIVTDPSGSAFIVSAYDRNGCFTNDTVNVYFSFYPQANFGHDTTLCNNQSLLLQLEPRPGFTEIGIFLWQDGSKKDTLRVTKSGLYWGQSTYKGCTIRDSIQVSYVSAEEVNLGSDTTLCVGDSLTLKVNASNANYKWSTGESTSSIIVKNDGTYWVKVNNGSCTVTDTIRVKFQPKPILFLGNDTTICDQQKMTLRAGSSNSTYLWQDNSTKETFVVSQPGLYWAQVTNNKCSVRDSININYKSLPILNIGNDTTICTNQSLMLSAAHSSIESFIWQDHSIQSSFLATQAGTYYVSVKGFNGCVNSDTLNLSMQPLPAFNLGSDTVLCKTTSILLSVNLNNAHYLWNSGNATNSLLVSEPGLYWLEAMQNGCSKRDSIIISYKPMPVVSLGNDTTLCEGKAMVLNVGYPAATYLWQDHSTDPVQTISKPGIYNVQVNLNGCIKKDTVKVQYLNKPAFTLGNDTSICKGETIILRPNIFDVSFKWQNGSAASNYTVTQAGTYRLTASNICGSITHAIIVTNGVCELYLPTAFTPNKDGLNDVFRVKYPSFIKTFEMTIFNRFGQVIFKTTDPYIGWDGSFKNLLQPAGMYVWQINLVNLDNEKKFAKGTVLLLR